MTIKTRKSIIAIIAVMAVLTLLFIFGNSLKDSYESSEQSVAVKEILMSVLSVFGVEEDINIALVRNMAHVTEFALLGFFISLLALYFARRKGNASVVRYALFIGASMGVGTLVAIVDELLQLTVAGRACDAKDVLLDFIGISIGTALAGLVYYLFIKINLRKEQKNKEKEKICKNT